MNKEQQELLDEAYENYRSKSKDIDLPENLYNKLIDDLNKDAMFPIDNPNRMLTQEEFINKCKTDTEFSEKWGLKIEEQELTYSERYKIWFTNNFETGMEYCEDVKPDFNNEYYEPTPTKLIKVTYNNKTIESYV
jgi:hypothetical protein